MTNILIEASCDMPSYQLTVKDFGRLEKELPINVKSKLSRNILAADLKWCDILYILRGNDTLSLYLAKKAKELGRMVILGLDDDLLEFQSNQHPKIDKIGKESLTAILSIADVMLTTSRYLAKKYHSLYGIECALSDTIVEPEDFDIKIPHDERIKIVYAACSSHKFFFDKLISPILQRVAEKYSDKISLTSIGPTLSIDGLPIPTNQIDSMPFQEYQCYMKTHHFDVGLAPLIDNEMCRSKYFNKYLEYSRHNICGIYSNVLPYSLIVENEYNGLLVDNNPEEWYNAICQILDSCALRNTCITNAKNHILNNFSITAIMGKLMEQIPFLVSFKAPKAKLVFMRPMYLYFIVCELRRRVLFMINTH